MKTSDNPLITSAPQRGGDVLNTPDPRRGEYHFAWKQQREMATAGPRAHPAHAVEGNAQTREQTRAFTGAT
jgi:hypothetical protein